MCEFHNSNSNGLGDIWWTDKFSYFSSIDAPESGISAITVVHAIPIKMLKT